MNIRFHSASKPGPQILVLADDLTGALESGAAFARRGIESTVTLLTADWSGKPVLVIDTETRHVAEDEATRRVAEIGKNLPVESIFKKPISPHRAKFAPSFKACSLPGLVCYVPLYPQRGR